MAREVELEDPFQNMGAQLVKEVANPKQATMPATGTTTATVLAQAIINVGLKNVTAGANPMDLWRIDKAVAAVVESIKGQSEEVGDDLKKIEGCSPRIGQQRCRIGKLIAEAMRKVKKEGVITVDEAKKAQRLLWTL